MSTNDLWLAGVTLVLCLVTGLMHGFTTATAATFLIGAVALAALATVIGRTVDQLTDRLGAGATGVLQSALGNLPELFVCIFALRDGLITVVQAAIVGSILSNLLLVLGAAFLVGGLKFRTQRFDASRARGLIALLMLAVAALLVPSLASYVGSAAAAHERALSEVTSVVLLVVFAFSIPASVRRTQEDHEAAEAADLTRQWPLPLAVGVLAATALLAALVSEWFVDALTPSLEALHISQAFAGLVIVAIAGNAVEHVVGIQLAARNRADAAVSVVVNSPLQIALVLAPMLVLISPIVSSHPFTLVFPAPFVTTVAAAVVAVAFVIVDGESDALEGAALLGLYLVIAASFWWG